MVKKTLSFPNKQTTFYFDADFSYIEKLIGNRRAIFITDQHVFKRHTKKFRKWKTIVCPAGEQFKQQSTIDNIVQQLIELHADRKTMLIGVGGGVITDLTGYIASVYMRGLSFGFVPTSLLAMVDAAIGGKNGIDVGMYKNMIGTICQPDFLLYDNTFLKTLPHSEWINGFAEIIKHACIKDVYMFKQLIQHTITDYKKEPRLLNALIRRNAMIKANIVLQDEYEQQERRLLNFGHTFGHAIENLYNLSHGKAVAIGMVVASKFSTLITSDKSTAQIIQLLRRYQLPTSICFDATAVMKILQMDKKRENDIIHYVLLEKIGRAILKPVAVSTFSSFIQQLSL